MESLNDIFTQNDNHDLSHKQTHVVQAAMVIILDS
jgi:hypothetical protein